MVTLFCVLIWSSASHAQAWMDPAWQERVPIVVTNSSALPLSDFQIELELNNMFPFSQAQSNGADVRVTQDDGVTLVDNWIKTWDTTAETASVWIEVPLIPPNSEVTLYIYFGNPFAVSGSDGDATFLFFDDFNDDPPGYFALSGPQTTMVADLTWETRAPHTMSVIEMNGPTYKYWGYYALQGGFGGVGRARSHDLINWVKDANPLFTNGRWASTLLVGGTVHMMVTKDFPLISQIVLRTSTDGINFTEAEVVVLPESGIKNQNPHLFYNDDNGQYYLFWFRNNAGQYEI